MASGLQQAGKWVRGICPSSRFSSLSLSLSLSHVSPWWKLRNRRTDCPIVPAPVAIYYTYSIQYTLYSRPLVLYSRWEGMGGYVYIPNMGVYAGLGIRSSVFQSNQSFFVIERSKDRFDHGWSFLKIERSKDRRSRSNSQPCHLVLSMIRVGNLIIGFSIEFDVFLWKKDWFNGKKDQSGSIYSLSIFFNPNPRGQGP